jgi:hypothetical protein
MYWNLLEDLPFLHSVLEFRFQTPRQRHWHFLVEIKRHGHVVASYAATEFEQVRFPLNLFQSETTHPRVPACILVIAVAMTASVPSQVPYPCPLACLSSHRLYTYHPKPPVSGSSNSAGMKTHLTSVLLLLNVYPSHLKYCAS